MLSFSDLEQARCFSIFIPNNIGSLGHSNEAREIKSIQMRKDEAKLSLFTDDRFLIRENSRFHHKTINTNKRAQQSLNILVNIKYKQQFYMSTENYLRNSTYNSYKKGKLKQIKYFYKKNYRIFVKAIEKDINNKNIFLTLELKN